jgi:uncharacterized protein YdeI (YjbR/CyaY-like superfamily)
MISDPDHYFASGCGRCKRFNTPECSVRRWIDGVTALRSICSGAGLAETVKWGHPCYMHRGRNIALIGAHRNSFHLSFMNAGLLTGNSHVLVKSGPNSSHPDSVRFTSNNEVEALAPALRDLLAQAMRHAEAGTRPVRDVRELVLPQELSAALGRDQDLAQAFGRLSPGRQRSYVVALSSAKTSSTREARIMRFRERILSGRGATER